jgi:hypothetical protein
MSEGSGAIRRRLISVSLGVIAALLALGGVLLQLDAWRRLETFRLPPVSQVGFFFGLAVYGLLAAAEGALSVQRATTAKAIAMIAIAGTFAYQGLNGAAGGSTAAVAVLYAGAIGLVAGVVRSTESRSVVLAVVGGALASAALSIGVSALIRSIGKGFP